MARRHFRWVTKWRIPSDQPETSLLTRRAYRVREEERRLVIKSNEHAGGLFKENTAQRKWGGTLRPFVGGRKGCKNEEREKRRFGRIWTVVERE